MNVNYRISVFGSVTLLLLTSTNFLFGMFGSSPIDIKEHECIIESGLSSSFSSDETGERDQLLELIDELKLKQNLHIDCDKFIAKFKAKKQAEKHHRHMGTCMFQGECDCPKLDEDKIAESALKLHFSKSDPGKKFFLIIESIVRASTFIENLTSSAISENWAYVNQLYKLIETHKIAMHNQKALFDEKSKLRLLWLMINQYCKGYNLVSVDIMRAYTSKTNYMTQPTWFSEAHACFSMLPAFYIDTIRHILGTRKILLLEEENGSSIWAEQ